MVEARRSIVQIKIVGKLKTWVGYVGVARIFDWGGPNRKSHAMTSSETSKEKFFVGAKVS